MPTDAVRSDYLGGSSGGEGGEVVVQPQRVVTKERGWGVGWEAEKTKGDG